MSGKHKLYYTPFLLRIFLIPLITTPFLFQLYLSFLLIWLGEIIVWEEYHQNLKMESKKFLGFFFYPLKWKAFLKKAFLLCLDFLGVEELASRSRPCFQEIEWDLDLSSWGYFDNGIQELNPISKGTGCERTEQRRHSIPQVQNW